MLKGLNGVFNRIAGQKPEASTAPKKVLAPAAQTPDYSTQNRELFHRFARENRPPDYFFGFGVVYHTPDGSTGSIGINSRDPDEALALFEKRFGGSARVGFIQFEDPDHWRYSENNQLAAPPKKDSFQSSRAANGGWINPAHFATQQPTPASYADQNREQFDRFAKENPKPDYYFAYHVRYREPLGPGQVAIKAQDPRKAAELFNKTFGAAARVDRVTYCDPDHDFVKGRWIGPE